MMSKEPIGVHIRWMIRRDMAEVLAIEEESFEFPWTADDFKRCLRQRHVMPMVAEHKERVVGFMIYELHKRRFHLLNVAVHPEYRRRLVGSQLIQSVTKKLSPQRRTRVEGLVRETNLAAQLFLRSMAFRAVATARGAYDDTTEDAYQMVCTVDLAVPTNRIKGLLQGVARLYDYQPPPAPEPEPYYNDCPMMVGGSLDGKPATDVDWNAIYAREGGDVSMGKFVFVHVSRGRWDIYVRDAHGNGNLANRETSEEKAKDWARAYVEENLRKRRGA